MITYEEFTTKTNFNFQELLAISHNNLIINPPDDVGVLPAPPFLMFDRITEIVRSNRNGKIVAEQDIKLDAWYFQCHFRNDPVQPGCLGIDALWQLMGFWCATSGACGTGRALGSKEINFMGQIRPHNKIVRYEVSNLKLIKNSTQSICLGDGKVFVDDKLIYEANGLKVGKFQNIKYETYPWNGANGEEK